MKKTKRLNPDWIDLSKPVPQAKTDFITRQTRNIPYGDDPLQQLDIYLPEKGDGPFPVIVMVHGGGFSACDKHDFHLYPTFYGLQQGFAVAAVNYRLSPAVRFPEHYFDLMRALLWLKMNGAEKSLDVNNIFLWGTSAGGNLVLQAGCKKGIPLPDELKAAKDIRIRAVAAMCPGLDLTSYGNTGSLFERLMVRFLFRTLQRDVLGSKKVSEDVTRRLNPTTYIEGGIVPVYLQQGTADPAVPFAQVKEFSEKLAAILPAKDLVFEALDGTPHAGADDRFLVPEAVNPVLRFFEQHMSR
jgi:acetyl esterase/lipase